MNIKSKLPEIGTNIFSIMSGLASEYDAINLAQGFPNFDPPEELKQLVTHFLLSNKNQYAAMKGVAQLREAIAEKVSKLYNKSWDIDRNICVTSGASEALFTAIQALVPTGSEVIVLEPCYDLYTPAIKLAGANKVSYSLKGPHFRPDWDEIAALITPLTSMIIVNTPHNPSGTILQREDLDRLYYLVKETDIVVLSDEVYEHLVFDENQHHSLISNHPISNQTLAVFSFGKTFHCTGWKIGYCIGPDVLMEEFYKVHQFNVFSVPHFIQCAIGEYLKNEATYISLSSFYQSKRDLFAAEMADSRFEALPCSGSFFQVYDYSQISEEDDLSFSRRLTKDYGVAVIPVSAFYSTNSEEKLVRFCFAKTEDVLLEAASRLRKV